jgi:Methyltransferase FkbM domain
MSMPQLNTFRASCLIQVLFCVALTIIGIVRWPSISIKRQTSGDSSAVPLETSADFSANRQPVASVVTPSVGTKIASKGNDNCLCPGANVFKAEEIREAVGLRNKWTRALPFAVESDFNRYSAIGGPESEGLLGFDTKESHQRFDFMGPVAPQCKSIESFGQGDNEKRACALTEFVGATLPGARCTIISLGSNNQWGFEEAIFANFPDCEIHTLDCNLAKEVRPPIEISSRTTLHPVCVGSQDAIVDGRHYLSWKSITRLINVTDAPLYLKMDIEGFEYEVLRSIVEEKFLSPMQIAFELHFKTDNPVSWIKRSKSSVEIAMFLEYLYHQGGYFLIDRHDNIFCPHCTEILISKILCPCGETLPQRQPAFPGGF